MGQEIVRKNLDFEPVGDGATICGNLGITSNTSGYPGDSVE